MSDDGVRAATYQLVISVDARRSGEYDDGDKPELRKQLYHVVGPAFTKAGAQAADVHLEDRGDGILATVAASVPPSALLGVWLVEVHERLRASNRVLARPLGLRVGMHVGPVREDRWGVNGRAVDLACRLTDSQKARDVLDEARADLVCVVSDQLYEDAVSPGGWGIDPETYLSASVRAKEGVVTAWFHLPGRGRPLKDVPPGVSPGWPPDPAPLPEGPSAPAETRFTAARDVHHHDAPVYRAPVHFGDNHTGPAPRRGEAGDE